MELSIPLRIVLGGVISAKDDLTNRIKRKEKSIKRKIASIADHKDHIQRIRNNSNMSSSLKSKRIKSLERKIVNDKRILETYEEQLDSLFQDRDNREQYQKDAEKHAQEIDPGETD